MKDTQENNSSRRGRKTITNLVGQETMKLTRKTNEPMRARKVSSMINLVKQQNLKMNNAKTKDQ
jgi:hypothetical protein